MRIFSIVLLLIIFIALMLLLFGCTYNLYLVKDTPKIQEVKPTEIRIKKCDVPWCAVLHVVTYDSTVFKH